MTVTESDGSADLTITVNEKILLHLKDFTGYREEKEVPKAISQKGIASAIRILPSHIPRALKRLMQDGLVTERDGYVEGGARKMRVYFLTEDGVQRTRKLAERVGSIVVDMKKDGRVAKVPLCEINLHLRNKLTMLQLCIHYTHSKAFDLTRIDSGQKVVDFTESAPKVSVFVGREKDFENLKRIMAERKVVVIFGGKGTGKTALASRYIENLRTRQSIFWYQLHPSDDLLEIMNSLAEFLELMGIKGLSEYLQGGRTNVLESLRVLLSTLSESETLLVFDNYYEQRQDVVEFFSILVNMIRETKGINVLITARENIPFYDWFYSRNELDRKVVGEIHLRGLDMESSRKIIAIKSIADDAFKQIYQLTKGVPQLLEYVRDEDSHALKSTGLFTAQEVRLMLGLKKVLKR